MHIKLSRAQVARAEGLLAAQVYQPVFFAKLAQLGIHPRTNEEAVNYLKLAGFLRQQAAARLGAGVLAQDPPTPGYIDAARKYVKADQQVKAAAYVYSLATN